MRKSALFSIVFLIFCGISFPQSPSPPISPNYKIRDENTPEFWNNLRIMPIQFLEKNEDKNGRVRLSAVFASNFVVESIDFLLLAEKKNESDPSFFEQKEDWEEQIDRKTFLKKFKRNYWITVYLEAGKENVLVAAHKFQSWPALKSSYASHPNQFRRSVNDVDFWKDIRIKMLYFYEIKDNKAYWLFLQSIDKTEPFSENDRQLISLPNGWMVYKRTTTNHLQDFRAFEEGILQIQENTIYHRQEMENSKPRKVLKFTIIDSKLRLRPLEIEKKYFLENHQKHFWICFYDLKNQSLVRIVEALEKPREEKN